MIKRIFHKKTSSTSNVQQQQQQQSSLQLPIPTSTSLITDNISTNVNIQQQQPQQQQQEPIQNAQNLAIQTQSSQTQICTNNGGNVNSSASASGSSGSILNRLKIQLENVVSIKHHQPQNDTLKTVIEEDSLTPVVPVQVQHQNDQQLLLDNFLLKHKFDSIKVVLKDAKINSIEKLAKLSLTDLNVQLTADLKDTLKQSIKLAKHKQSKLNKSNRLITNNLHITNDDVIFKQPKVPSQLVSQTPSVTTNTLSNTQTQILSPILKSPNQSPSTTTIEYPLRTRILRHLSAGNSLISQANNDDFITIPSSSSNYCCVCAANQQAQSRRQSWGSYSYLNSANSCHRNSYYGSHHGNLLNSAHRTSKSSLNNASIGTPTGNHTLVSNVTLSLQPQTSQTNLCESNLIKFKTNKLGSSAPNLSNNLKEMSISRKNSTKTRSVFHPFNSLNSSNSGSVSSSPSTPAPLSLSSHQNSNALESPRSSLNSQTSSGRLHISNRIQQCKQFDARRWSFASMHSSSGYGTNTPPQSIGNTTVPSNTGGYNSNNSSQYSSQSNLVVPQANTQLSMRTCNHQCFCGQTKSLNETEMANRRSRLCSSNDSSNLDDSSDYNGRLSPSFHLNRARARSLSCSPSKLHNESDIIMMQNEKFKEKFPKACKQMEENLMAFIDNKKLDANLDAAARFVHNQIIELAKSALDKSKDSQLTCAYFDELTNSLEKLLSEARDKCEPTSVDCLKELVKKFLLTISRVARLLECLEFDPLEFCHLLDAAAAQAKNYIKSDIPKYIISKLGLTRDPLEDFSVIHEPTTTTRELHFKQPTETDFEELKLISNGAYGAVYLVRHKQLNERYAMKKIKKHNLILRNQLQQVFTERDIMIFTDNPFVVALVCTFETKKYLCMVMEYVEGGDVATLIKNMGPLPLDMARIYFAETTLAVEYLHSYGIIHRDLKPDNLLITSMGHIKLTDFGLSKVGLMNLTTNFYEGNYTKKDHYCKEFNDKQVFGTPQYLAPEVILRQGYGKAVDWYSMGIILYEFLTSFPPFNGNTPEELFANVISGEIIWPEGDDELVYMPEDAKHLITGLLKHDPLERLGASGAIEVKDHPFFATIDWDNLLRIKADFIPQLEGPDDTSYFDTRTDRYNHESDSNEEKDYLQSEKARQNSIEDSSTVTVPNSDSELFASFSSCSSKFKLNSQNLLNSSLNTSQNSTIVEAKSSLNENELKKNEDNKLIDKLISSSQQRLDENESNKLNLVKNTLKSNTKINKSPTKESIVVDSRLKTEHELNVKQVQQQQPRQQKSKSMKEEAPKFNVTSEKWINNGKKSKGLSSRSHLSSASFNCKRSEMQNYRFPNSVSHSKINLLVDSTPINQRNRQNTSPATNSTSNYDSSPIRQLINDSKERLPIRIRRGPRGFGFTLRAIKVYFGDSDNYTIQHLVIQVDENGPAHEAGLLTNQLITHVNENIVCGLMHHEIVHNILSGGPLLSLQTIPINETNIKSGGRKRSPSKSKLSRPLANRTQQPEIYNRRSTGEFLVPQTTTVNPTLPQERKKKATLFRKLSEKRAQRFEYLAQQQQILDMSKRNMSTNDLRAIKPTNQHYHQHHIHHQPVHSLPPSLLYDHSTSSTTSSPTSSIPTSPAIGFNSRPRSLIVLNPQDDQLSLPYHSSSSSLASSPITNPQLQLRPLTLIPPVTQNQIIYHRSPCSSSSSCSSIPTNSTIIFQPNIIQLSPSPLAISDGLPLQYGNPKITQTFTPTTNQPNLVWIPQHQHQHSSLTNPNEHQHQQH